MATQGDRTLQYTGDLYNQDNVYDIPWCNK